MTKVDPFSIFSDMKNLTKDQVELVFSLFLAQNADNKISDLFPSDEPSKQVKIGSLVIGKSKFEVWLVDHINEEVPFRYNRNEGFTTWDNLDKPWYLFDIMKYICLEDKV